MHHPTVKPKMILYDFNNTVIPFVYDGSDAEYSEFSKSRGIWVERRNKFYKDYSQDENLKWNFHSLTIYPSGEYESEFIWDNEAHLDYLKTNVNNWFIYVYEKACERIQDRCNDLSIDCPALVEMTVVFDALGISKPALFYSENNPAMTFKLHLEQIYFYLEQPYESVFAEYDMIRKQVDGDVITDNQKQYKTTNEGELKGIFPRWNKLTFTLEPDSPYISYEEVREKLKFEWIEENA